MPEISVKIACHEANDISTSSATALIAIKRLSKIIFFTASMYESWLLYFGIWQPWCCNLPTDSFDIRALFVLFTVTSKIHLAQKMELNREHIRAIILYNFRSGVTEQQWIDKLNSFFGDETP